MTTQNRRFFSCVVCGTNRPIDQVGWVNGNTKTCKYCVHQRKPQAKKRESGYENGSFARWIIDNC